MLISDHGVVSWLPFPDGTVRVAGPVQGVRAPKTPMRWARDDAAREVSVFLVEQERLVADPALRIAELHHCVNHRVHSRMANVWGRGRIWIAGDAAHVHPPVGEQALNLGFADAEALALRLAGHGAPSWSTYQTERAAVAEATLEQVAVAPLIESIRAARTDADLERLQTMLDLMAVRFSHLATDFGASGADRLGSADPRERQTLRPGRRLYGQGPMQPVPHRPGWWWHPQRQEQLVQVTPDRHVRAIETLALAVGANA